MLKSSCITGQLTALVLDLNYQQVFDVLDHFLLFCKVTLLQPVMQV